mmetsp:Transcript_30977/g.30517  ORF Transcript_30977/g.30517 Transcript_30977/m.30517 type:complete len:202 (+) Transcript_30977:768-1373(+)
MPSNELSKFLNTSNASNLFISNRGSPNMVSQELMPYNCPDFKGLGKSNEIVNHSHMIENGPLSNMMSERASRLGHLTKSPNKREKKAIRNNMRMENDAWDKICEVKSISGSQGEDEFIQNLHKNPKVANPYMYSLDNNSYISDIDHQKEQFGDNYSVGSHKKLNDISGFSHLQNNNFELMSQPSNKGFSDLKSENSNGREN